MVGHDGPDVEHVIAVVADALDWIGAERLQPGLETTAEHLARFGHLMLSEDLLTKLRDVSVATVRHIMRRRAPTWRPTAGRWRWRWR